MTPQDARDAMIDAAAGESRVFGSKDWAASVFDYLTGRGFSISLASVRDHTRCEFGCENGVLPPLLNLPSEPCPGGSPVVWAAPPDPESETP